MITTEDELEEDMIYWRRRAEAAEASSVKVPDRYYGFWPDESRAKAVQALRDVVDRFDISTSFGAEAACEQLWNAMTDPRDPVGGSSNG